MFISFFGGKESGLFFSSNLFCCSFSFIPLRYKELFWYLDLKNIWLKYSSQFILFDGSFSNNFWTKSFNSLFSIFVDKLFPYLSILIINAFSLSTENGNLPYSNIYNYTYTP